MSYTNKVVKGGGELHKEFKNKETVEEVLKYPFVENKERKITKETCEKFGVRASVSEYDGKTPTAFYFPSYNQRGEITGFSKQDITKRKDEDYHWSTVGSVSITNKLFGQSIAEKINRKHTNCTYTEGQWDCLSVYQSQCLSVKGTKYDGHEPFVVSIPLGTKNAVESLLHNKDFVNSFDSMTLFFDGDSATPAELKKGIMRGKEATEAVSAAFIGSISLYSVQPQGGFKDASDYLQDVNNVFGDSRQAQLALAKLVQFDRKPLVTEKIAHVDSISLDELCEPIPTGIEIKSFPKLSEMLYGWRTGELSVVTARSGAGKTTGMTKIAEDAIDSGEKLGLIYLEEKNKQTLQRFVSSQLKVSYKKFKRDPLSVASKEDIKSVYDRFKSNKQIVMLDHFGSLPIKELMSKIKHMYFVEGCRYILLDHLSMVISGSDISDERKEIDIVMTEIAAFCAAHDVAVMLVVHLNRQGSNQIQPPKGKENEPFWVQVTKETMRGSGSLEQIAWNVLGLEQEILPDRKRGRVRWVVLKNREGGDIGVADTFKLNDTDWSIIHYNDDEFSNNCVAVDENIISVKEGVDF